jgi:hypothetical protein
VGAPDWCSGARTSPSDTLGEAKNLLLVGYKQILLVILSEAKNLLLIGYKKIFPVILSKAKNLLASARRMTHWESRARVRALLPLAPERQILRR